MKGSLKQCIKKSNLSEQFVNYIKLNTSVSELTSNVKIFDEVALCNKGFRDLSQRIVNEQRYFAVV